MVTCVDEQACGGQSSLWRTGDEVAHAGIGDEKLHMKLGMTELAGKVIERRDRG